MISFRGSVAFIAITITVLLAGCPSGEDSPGDAAAADGDPASDSGGTAADGGMTGPDAAAPHVTITVLVSGTGRVVSSPAGIDCTTACAGFFPLGTSVTLTAMNDGGHLFQGFSGDCTGASCMLPGDADAVVTATFTADASQVWVRQLGNDWPDEQVYAVTMDTGANVTIAGTFSGDVDFGGGVFTSVGGDTFVARYASDGTPLWSRAFPGTRLLAGRPLAIDASGNLLVAGYYANTVDFGGGAILSSMAGSGDIFVAKLSVVDGSTLWARGAGGDSLDSARAVAVDASGDVYVTGYYRTWGDFGSGPVVGNSWGSVFLIKYEGVSGATLWSATHYETGFVTAEGGSLAVDAAGDVYVVGPLQASTFAPFGAYVAKFSATDGTFVWGHEYGGSAGVGASAEDVVVAADGDLVVTGTFSAGPVDFGGGPLLPAFDSADLYLVKYAAADGAHVWSKGIGSDGYENGTSLAALPGGDILVAGGFMSSVMFGATGTTARLSAGGRDPFVAEYAADGAYVSAAVFGGALNDEARGVATDGNGHAALVGEFSDVVPIAGTSYTALGTQDIFVISTTVPISEGDL